MNCCLRAQTFEAASVRPKDPSEPPSSTCSGGPGTKDPLRYRCASESIAGFVKTAYDVSYQDMDVPAAWYANTNDGYDLEAVIKEGATQDEFRIMLQNLLAERFHLKWHREAREMDSYILTAPKPKFRPSSPDAKYSLVGSNLYNRAEPIKIVARGMTMQALTGLLPPIAGKRVVNETNLDGAFDFDLEFVSPDPTAAVDGPSMFTAFSELGLSLKAGKRPVSVFVIESADRTPVPN